MSLASVMVYVDSEQQDEGQIAVAEAVARNFGAALLGISAVAIDPPFVAEGVIIEQTTADDLKRMRATLGVGQLAFRPSCPTLSVPDGVTRLSGDRIVVGWKDAREARLAVRDALPFLTRAPQVTRDVAKYLQRHGVSCQHEVRVHTAEQDAGYPPPTSARTSS